MHRLKHPVKQQLLTTTVLQYKEASSTSRWPRRRISMASLISTSSSPLLSVRYNINSSSSAAAVTVHSITQSSSSYYSRSSPSSRTHLSTFNYNSLIRSQTDAGHPDRALLMFHRMLAFEALPPDPFTFPTVLKACAHLTAVAEGQQIHSSVLKSHFATSDDIFILSSLIHFYASCGRLADARLVFDKMPIRSIPSWNAMLDGYARSGDLESAQELFGEMTDRNIFSWNTLICGYVREGRAWEALKLFVDLQMSAEQQPDDSTMVSVISAVEDLCLLALGRGAHAYVVRHMCSLDRALGVVLINMYSKCGSIGSAYNVFIDIQRKNVSHWTSMIAGFATHGSADAALKVFEEMISSGAKPNHITFVTVLSACSHGGLVNKGLECFELMKSFSIEPTAHHYGCLVDLLGRAGLIEEAVGLVSSMALEPGPVIWSTLLAACRNYERAEAAEAAARKLTELDSSGGSSYVLLSNLYANLGRWEDFRIVRKVMEDREVTKVAGISWIEINGLIHEFVSGDKFHMKTMEIYGVLDGMWSYLRREEDHEFFFFNFIVFW